MMKKVIGLLIVMMVILPANTYAFDAKVSEVTPQFFYVNDKESLSNDNSVEGDYICVEDTNNDLAIKSTDGQIEPLTTCSESGGYGLGSGGAVRWEINPRFSTIHTFTGTLTITKYIAGAPILWGMGLYL